MPDCPYCPFTSAFIGDVEEHSIDEHKKKLFTCYDLKCNDFLCKTATELNIHDQLNHPEKTLVCKVCTNVTSFKSTRTLTEHYKVFHKNLLGYLSMPKTCADFNNRLSAEEKLLRLGFHGCRGTLIKRSFITSFDKDNYRPLWTFEYLHPKAAIEMKGYGSQFPRYFEDSEVDKRHLNPSLLGSINKHASHLACASNHWFDVKAFTESYYLTNIVALPKEVNTGIWAGLERLGRKLLNYWDHVSVFSGLIYDDSILPYKFDKENPIWKPKSLYKIFVLESEIRKTQIHVYCIPDVNTKEIPQLNFTSTLEDIEVLTGIRFLTSSYFPYNTFRCYTCHEILNSAEEQDEHIAVHANQPRCKRCGDLFSTKKQLELHISLCYLKCGECTRMFPSERCLHVHVKHMHKPQICDVCKKELSNMLTLKDHKLTHTDKPNFQCKHCKGWYYARSTVTDHLRNKHKELEPCYFNRETGKEITVKQWSRTIKTKTQKDDRKARFKCNVCEKAFEYKYLLGCHQKVHSAEPNYKCKYCSRTFKTRAAAYSHSQIKHEGKTRCCINIKTGEERCQFPKLENSYRKKRKDLTNPVISSIAKRKPHHVPTVKNSSSSESSDDDDFIAPPRKMKRQ